MGNTSCAQGRPLARSSAWLRGESRGPGIWVTVLQPCPSHGRPWSRLQGICFPYKKGSEKYSSSPRVMWFLAAMHSASLGLNKSHEGLAQCFGTLRPSSSHPPSYLPPPPTTLRPFPDNSPLLQRHRAESRRGWFVAQPALSRATLPFPRPCEAAGPTAPAFLSERTERFPNVAKMTQKISPS